MSTKLEIHAHTPEWAKPGHRWESEVDGSFVRAIDSEPIVISSSRRAGEVLGVVAQLDQSTVGPDCSTVRVQRMRDDNLPPAELFEVTVAEARELAQALIKAADMAEQAVRS